jgi:hypothetical protein
MAFISKKGYEGFDGNSAVGAGLTIEEVENIALEQGVTAANAVLSGSNIGEVAVMYTQDNGLLSTPTQADIFGAVPINAVFLEDTSLAPPSLNVFSNGKIQDVFNGTSVLNFHIAISGVKSGGGTADFRFYLGRNTDGTGVIKITNDLITTQIVERNFSASTGFVGFTVQCTSDNNYYYQLHVADMGGTSSFIGSQVTINVTRVSGTPA